MVRYIEYKKMFFRKIKKEKNKYYISKLNKRVSNKLFKKLKKEKINKIVCDKYIMENNQFLNYLYAKQLYIYNGRKLYKYIIKNILNYLKQFNIKLEKLNVAILVNENLQINNKIIEEASGIFKRISIITNNSKKFLKLENKLEEEGIPINISNNKRKSLSKTDIIINIDFPNELINKFNINTKAIIINIEEKIKIKNKTFKGININYYQINFEDKFLEYENFDKNIIYESMFFDIDIKNKFNIDKLKIKNLIGNNGIISVEEIKNIAII